MTVLLVVGCGRCGWRYSADEEAEVRRFGVQGHVGAYAGLCSRDGCDGVLRVRQRVEGCLLVTEEARFYNDPKWAIQSDEDNAIFRAIAKAGCPEGRMFISDERALTFSGSKLWLRLG